MQDIKEGELRDSGSNTNTKICFEVRATAPRPRLHIEGFSLFTIGSFTIGPPPRNYNSTLGVHNSNSLSPLHKRKAQSLTQTKVKNQLGDQKNQKHNLVISKDPD